ncbi:MAG: OmpA family protein [Desulfobacterales bacterium]|jgi:outer membrane protein OmpA-like peptidoglycan-associated protein
MQNLNGKISRMAAIGITVFLLLACAGAQPDVQPIPRSANPTDVVNAFDGEIATARKNQLNVLSPDWFSKAETSLARAKKALSKGDEISEIMDNVAQGRARLKKAEEMAQVARVTLPEVIKSREMARAAGATQLSGYAWAEDEFLTLTKAIENNNLRLAQRDRHRVSQAFRKLELQAIKDQTIGEVRKLLAQADQEGARKYARYSFSVAQQKLRNTDAFITKNPYEKEKMQAMANDALFYSQRLIQMNRQSQKIRTMESEEIARWIEDMLRQITLKLPAPDLRNENFETQVENIVESASAMKRDHDFVIQQTKEQEAEIGAMRKRIAALEGKTKEQQAAKERLATEKEFNEKFTRIQNYFTPEEAEVYKQGNQLVIRLKSIQFPVGKEIIMPNNYQTLSRVQKAIRTFGEPDVVIEGYTDSTGSDEVNEHLSQKRAESVRDYLVANRTLPYSKIVAVGYGSMRPLASNATASGRAVNRRIDVIVKPASQLE